MDIYILYLRKSRADNPDMTVAEVLRKHEAILQEYALQELGHTIPEEFIYREVVSGETISARPMMQEVLRIMEVSEVKGILVVEPQRLSRGDLEDCGRIVNAFRYTNTLVMTPSKTYNIADEYDRKFFELELTRGNDYLEYTKKILNRGRLASVKRGNYIGSVAPYGYDKVHIKDADSKNSSSTLKVNEEEAAAVRMMYDLYVHQHMGFNNIARTLDGCGMKPRRSDHWSPTAIKDMLENPIYTGKIKWNWRKVNKVMVDGKLTYTRPKTSGDVYPGKHPAIIDDITYQLALNRHRERIYYPNRVKCRNPYSGLLYCSCGRAMIYKPYNNSAHTNPVLVCADQVHCRTRSVSYDDLNNKMISILENAIDNFSAALRSKPKDISCINKAAIDNMESELEKLNLRDMRQKEAFEDGIYTKEEYLLQNSRLQKRRSEIAASLVELRKRKPESVNYQDKITSYSEAVKALKDDEVSAYDKNVLLKQIVSKAVYISSSKAKYGNGHYDNPYDLDVFFCD